MFGVFLITSWRILTNAFVRKKKIFAVCQFCGLLLGWKEKGETRDEHLENELAIIPYGRSEGMKLMGSSNDAQMCSPRQ